ncbi:MAG: hypothetical protein WCJ39_03030 [bacterium]
MLFQTDTSYSQELLAAYTYAYKIGITTIPDIEKAQLEGQLIRKDLAKMMVNFAIKQLGKTPNTGLNCSFNDMKNETLERQQYARLACQLHIMGHNPDGSLSKQFSPNDLVTRAQFGTVLSRVLWGNLYNGGVTYYLNHLKALQKIGIVKTISNADALEKRGYVMLMLMRSSEIK